MRELETRVLAPFCFYVMKRVINFTVGYRPVSLIFYDDEHEGPGYTVVAKRSKNKSVIFGRFKHFEDAKAYYTKYAEYYPFVKFDVYPNLF